MESDKEVNGVHKLSNSNTQHEATNQKQVSIENSALPSIQPAYHLSTTNFEFMAKDISQLDDEERLEQKLAFYFQPYSSNGYDFKEFMKFDADENYSEETVHIKPQSKEINWGPIVACLRDEIQQQLPDKLEEACKKIS